MNVAFVPGALCSALRGWLGCLGTRVAFVVTLVLVSCWATDARAYAWMIRHGYSKCATCHTDPSGGETLTHMGRVQGQLLMTYPWDGAPVLDNQAKFLNGQNEPDNIRLGGSLRGMAIHILGDQAPEENPRFFPMQADLYASADFSWIRAGASVGASRTTPHSRHTKGAQITGGQEGFQAVSRSHWIGADLGDDVLVRVGRLNLPFGVRTPEHTLWARETTRTDRESDQQHGIAISASSGGWRGEYMFVLGNYQVAPDKFRERGYSAYLEYLLFEKLAVGVSSMLLQSKAGPYFSPTGSRTRRAAHGATVRYSPIDMVGVLAEVDILKTTGSKVGYTGFATVDFEYLQGLHGLATLEVLDNGRPEGGASGPSQGEQVRRYWLGANWFPWPHLDVRLDAVVSDGPTQLWAQLHYYF